MTENINHAERAHALLSASSAARWLACPPSAVAAEAYPQQDTEYTREGTLAHEVAEIIARASLDGSSWLAAINAKGGDVTREMIDCAQAYADYIQEQIKSPDAVVLLEQRVDFSPWVPEGFGTCDCLIIQEDTLTIIDYKYGQGVAVSAIDNPQMKLYALGAMNDYGIAMSEVAKVEMCIFQPRIDNISEDALTADELTTWAEKDVKPTAEKAYKGKGTHSPGAHCKFCPHAGRCKALTKLCTEYVTTHGAKIAVPVLAPHEVAEVLQMEPLISLWLKRVKDQALTTMLDGGEIPGFKVVAGRGSRTWADDLEAGQALVAAGYSNDQITKTELLSPAAMEKALGKKKVAELVGGHILTTTGAPTVVPVTDKRPAYDRLAEARSDFNT